MIGQNLRRDSDPQTNDSRRTPPAGHRHELGFPLSFKVALSNRRCLLRITQVCAKITLSERALPESRETGRTPEPFQPLGV